MDRSAGGKPQRSTWLWITILIVMLLVVIYWFTDPLGDAANVPQAQPTAPGGDLIVSPVDENAVPVELPTTNLTAVPPPGE